ncbi:MAG: hypothetical protein NDI90_08195 [Nitrospira sp. BO4]|jgi:hypothetical protein|nr:hypothetical protein [Nitrospira sp. BO4]
MERCIEIVSKTWQEGPILGVFTTKRALPTIASLCILSSLLGVEFVTPSFAEQLSRERSKLNQVDASAEMQDRLLSQDLAILKETVRSQDKRIDDSIGLVVRMSKDAAEAQNKTIDNIEKMAMRTGWLIGIIVTIITTIMGVVGFKGFKTLNSWRDQAEANVRTTAQAAGSIGQLVKDAKAKVEELDGSINKNRIDLRALEAVTRVMPRIGRSDLQTDPDNKHRLASEALLELNEAQRLNSALSASLLLEKAKALKRLDRYVEAFVVANQAAELAKNEQNKYDEARSYYNAGCYLALSGGANERDTALRYLANATSISPALKKFAAQDKDFDSLRNNQRFKELVFSESEGKFNGQGDDGSGKGESLTS